MIKPNARRSSPKQAKNSRFLQLVDFFITDIISLGSVLPRGFVNGTAMALFVPLVLLFAAPWAAEGQTARARTWRHEGAGWDTYSPGSSSAKAQNVRGRFIGLQGTLVQVEGHPVASNGGSLGVTKDRVWTANFDEISVADQTWIEDQVATEKKAKAAAEQRTAQEAERRLADEQRARYQSEEALKTADTRRLASGFTFMQHANQTAWICAALVLLLAVSDLRNRLSLGAPLGGLYSQGFHEVSAIHQTLTVARWPLAIFGIGLGLISLATAFQFLGRLLSAEWLAALGKLFFLALFCLATGLTWWAFTTLTEWLEGHRRPHQTDVTISATVEGIDEEEIRNLGRDRFPEGAVYDRDPMRRPRLFGLWMTGIFSATLLVLGIIVWLTEKSDRLWPMSEWLRTAVMERCLSLSSGSPWTGLIGVVASGMAVCFYLHNRKYQVLDFNHHWGVYLGAASVGSLYTPAWHPSFAFTWGVVLSFGVMAWLRFRAELGELRNVEAREHRFGPLRRAMEVGGQKLLDRVQNGGFFQFPPLNLKAVDSVLDASTRQIERNEYLCQPRFTRSMTDAVVHWLRMVVLEYRQMTVSRTTVLRNARSTIEGLRYPKVPVWDEKQFPLVVPDGFVSRIDEKLLGPEWIVVQLCGGCGGSGRVSCGSCGGKGYNDRTQTETQNGRTVTYTYRERCNTCAGTGRVTCSSCHGTGRLMWDQALQTHWEREVVNVSEPFVLNDDFLEEAMQKVFWQKTLLENRQPLNTVDTTPVEIDENDLLQLGHLMKDGIAHADSQSSATLYRMDLRLGGCLVHRVIFPRLNGLVGWIFGNRESVYMPKQPLSLQRMAVFSLLPPMVFAASIYLIHLALRLAEWAGVRD